MPFNNKSADSDTEVRVYSYGCVPKKPVVEQLFTQLRLANRYYNNLVRYRKDQLKAENEAMLQLSPALVEVEAAIEKASEKEQELFKQAKQQNVLERSSGAASDELRADLKAAQEGLRELYDRAKALRKPLYHDQLFIDERDRLQEEFKEACKQVRKDARTPDEDGVSLDWGTCGAWYDAFQAACKAHIVLFKRARESGDRRLYIAACRLAKEGPRFKRFTGEGRVGVQITGGGDPVEDVLNGKSMRLRIDPVEESTSSRSKRRDGHIRIGSTGPGGRTPVWADFRFRMHKGHELPEDGVVKRAYLVAKKIGTRTKWELQVSVAGRPKDWADRNVSDGLVAVDVGWRDMKDHVRVARWLGDDGQRGEILIPAERVQRYQKVKDLQSIRSKNLDSILSTLVSWKKQAADLPEWFQERFKGLHQWRSQSRLASAIKHWEQCRFDGDEAIFDEARVWWRQDCHLYDWQESQRKGEDRWRKNYYREVAAELSRSYRTVVVEDVDWSQFQRAQDPLKAKEVNEARKAAREERRRIAGVSYLIDALSNRMVETIEAPSRWTTQACHECGCIDHFDAENELHHTCSDCGEHWDQDDNACRNLLTLAI